MNADFDIIIVGSGPAGVSAAFPLVEKGLRVLMVDGGKKPEIEPVKLDYLTARSTEAEQWKWMVGTDFHALKNQGAVSPKLRVPSQAYSFNDFENENRITGKEFIAIGSMATGGLSNAWGCGVAQYSENEMSQFPHPRLELLDSYARISRRIGISGKNDDDMSDYFGLDEYLQKPIRMDELHTHIFDQYTYRRKKLNAQGFKLGRSRVAALSEDMTGRHACDLSGNCLWGCARHSLYSAADELPALRKHVNFTELSGFVVQRLRRANSGWCIEGKSLTDGALKSISSAKVMVAAGTLASTRLVMQSLNYAESLPILSCPTAAFLLWLPRKLGVSRSAGFGLGQLSFGLALQDETTSFGSTFATTGIPITEFVRHVPLGRRAGIDLLRELLRSCVVGNLFLPGHLTEAEARLQTDGSLLVSGKYGDRVAPLMNEAGQKLRNAYLSMGAILLPGSFTVGRPGGDIHYAGTLPMRENPEVGETSPVGEVKGMKGVYVVDGSCLPVLPAKSHTLTIMANADRIGRAIAQEHQA